MVPEFSMFFMFLLEKRFRLNLFKLILSCLIFTLERNSLSFFDGLKIFISELQCENSMSYHVMPRKNVTTRESPFYCQKYLVHAFVKEMKACKVSVKFVCDFQFK